MSDIQNLIPAFLPHLANNPKAAEATLENFNGIFHSLPEQNRKKIHVLIRLIMVSYGFRYFHSFKTGSLSSQTAWLRKWSKSPVPKIRAGVNGLRTLVLLSYYSSESSWAAIGYEGPLVKRARTTR